MAKITKEEYSRRRESAIKNLEKNKQIKTLNEEQHEIIAEVCTMRHRLHTSGDTLYHLEDIFCKEADRWMDNINNKLIKNNLNKIKFLPQIEDFPTCEDKIQRIIPEEVTEEKNLENFYKMMERMNTTIEIWLSQIDLNHGTTYAPTGVHRNMR